MRVRVVISLQTEVFLSCRGLLEPSDFPGFFGGLAETDDNDQPRFQVGDYVRVKGMFLLSLVPVYCH